MAGREVTITNPDKVFFPKTGHTKLDLVRYYLAVADGALRGVAGRPMALKRYPNGAEGEFFFQKRAPQSRPEWVETVELAFPSGRTAHEIVVHDEAQLAWVINLGCIDLNPHPVRADDLEHPDELRVDLDPIPGIEWPQILGVAMVTREVLDDLGLTGWPKTSGSRGFHVYCRIEPRWTFTEVRRAALALAREVERRAPDLATSKWWKEEPRCDPAAFTIDTVPDRFTRLGDPSEGIDQAAGSLEPLLELAAEHEAAGFGDAPWPPHYEKQAGEPPRVQPSKRRTAAGPKVREGIVPPPAPGKTVGPTGRRRPSMPLVEIARAATEAEAREGLERWKARHPAVWPYLEPADILVDSMRGRSTTWTRIRLNLRHVPEGERPAQEPLEVDYDPWEGVEWPPDQQPPGRR